MAINLGGDGDDLEETHEINVTPFIDVMLVLLIIFMVAAPLATVDIAVDLPTAVGTAGTASGPADLSQPESRRLAGAGGHAGDAARLCHRPWTQATDGDKTQRVFLRGDKTVAYDAVMQTLDALRGAGYLKVALVGLEATGRHHERACRHHLAAGRLGQAWLRWGGVPRCWWWHCMPTILLTLRRSVPAFGTAAPEAIMIDLAPAPPTPVPAPAEPEPPPPEPAPPEPAPPDTPPPDPVPPDPPPQLGSRHRRNRCRCQFPTCCRRCRRPR